MVENLLQAIHDIQSVHLENVVEGAAPTTARTQSFTISSAKLNAKNVANRSYDTTASATSCAGGQTLGFRIPSEKALNSSNTSTALRMKV